jgi:tetratricopeptide (TPR) repeat protein
MLRCVLAVAMTVVACDAAFAGPPFLRPGRVSIFRGPGRVSVNVASPWGGYSGTFPIPRGYDPYVYGRGYDGYVSPYGTYYNPQSGYVEHYLPPVHYPAELMYGPQAVRRFLGLDLPLAIPTPPLDAIAPPVAAAKPAVVEEGVEAGEPIELPPPRPRDSNAAAKERAAHFIAAGDNLFQEQKHQEALQRYKSAAQAAPDVASSYFRQGFALVATNRYSLAGDAFRRGLTLDPGWPSSEFRLDDVYGDAALAKRTHQDALANAALHDPENAELMFVLGVFLHFDGQADRAKKFFARAKELDGGRAASLDGFLATTP